MEDSASVVDVPARLPQDTRCWFYFRPAGCRHGDQCKFSHDNERTPGRVKPKKQRQLLALPAPESAAPSKQDGPARQQKYRAQARRKQQWHREDDWHEAPEYEP